MQAVSDGRWLLIEDINLAPPDVLASLVGLLERRQLYLPQRAQSITAHPGFQLIASVTSSPGAPCSTSRFVSSEWHWSPHSTCRRMHFFFDTSWTHEYRCSSGAVGQGCRCIRMSFSGCALGAGGGQAGAYGSAQGVRDLLGGLWSTVAVQAPGAAERLAILRQGYPQLAALLPAGLMALSLVKLAAGQPWEAEEASTLAPDGTSARQLRRLALSASLMLLHKRWRAVNGFTLWQR